MRLIDYEEATLAEFTGEPRRQALARQVEIGHFFDAPDLVEVAQAHIVADIEALSEAGVEYLEELAAYLCRRQRNRINFGRTRLCIGAS